MKGWPLFLSTKNTILKRYDGRFKDIFEEIYVKDYKAQYEAQGISYTHRLIDDMVAQVLKGEGGVVWACKNYDGDVMSDMIASAFGSLAMMTSVLVSPGGHFEYEAAHGTVQRHYYKHLKGETTSTNSVALIFAWAGCLRKRGELDGTAGVVRFADRLEKAAIKTVESGIMTGDLLAVARKSPSNRLVTTEGFIDAIAERLQRSLGHRKDSD